MDVKLLRLHVQLFRVEAESSFVLFVHIHSIHESGHHPEHIIICFQVFKMVVFFFRCSFIVRSVIVVVAVSILVNADW